jgi:hypothetical protein
MPAIDLVLRTPDDDGDRKLLADVQRHGWHITGITAEPSLPGYAFTVGLYYTLEVAELVVSGLPLAEAGILLNVMGAKQQAGARFLCETPRGDLLAGRQVLLRPVAPRHYRAHLGYAVWFYRDLPRIFPCWQAIWSDTQGRFPWDADVDPAVRAAQTLLDG